MENYELEPKACEALIASIVRQGLIDLCVLTIDADDAETEALREDWITASRLREALNNSVKQWDFVLPSINLQRIYDEIERDPEGVKQRLEGVRFEISGKQQVKDDD